MAKLSFFGCAGDCYSCRGPRVKAFCTADPMSLGEDPEETRSFASLQFNSAKRATIMRAEAIHLPGWRFISAERKLHASRPGSAEVRGLRLEDVDWRAG